MLAWRLMNLHIVAQAGVMVFHCGSLPSAKALDGESVVGGEVVNGQSEHVVLLSVLLF